MKGRHFAEKVKRTSKKTRSIVLSVVAVLELVLLITSMTFSWFEGLTSLEMFGEKIKTAPELYSHINLGENKSENDETYNEVIDLTKFFDAQRDVRLSPVSSADGKNFYAVYEGTAGEANAKYRKLYPEDINANIIRFEFNISSADGPTDVYLSEIVPRVFINGTEHNDEYCYPYRFAFSDGTTTHILSTNNQLDTTDDQCFINQKAVSSLNDDNTAKTITGTVERTRQYSYYKDHLTYIDGPGAGSAESGATKLAPLFSLKKDEVKTITVSVWMEALDYECLENTEYKPEPGSDISFGLKMCTSWSITREITVYDYTADKMIDDEDDSRNETALYVRNIDGDSDVTKRALYKLEYDGDRTWTGEIPIALKNCEFLWRPTDNPTSASYNSDDYPTYQAPSRGNETEVTIFGPNTCVWNLDPDNLVEIDFRDYLGWIADDGAQMYARIPYDGRILEYSMSETPTQDTNGKNSWSCWIPNDTNDVNFLRKVNDTMYNYWYASDRGEQTIYRATEEQGANLGKDNTYILYLALGLPDNTSFYSNNEHPSISYTNKTNKDYYDTADKNHMASTFDRTMYNPSLDEWLNLTKLRDDIYYIIFANRPTGTDKFFTIWNRSTIEDEREIPINTGFGIIGVAVLTGNTNSHTITVTRRAPLALSGAKENYHFTLTGTTTTLTSDLNTFSGTQKKGIWGDIETYPTGSYTTYFVPMNATSKVTVSYTYNYKDYVIDMEQGDDGIWYTNFIPDATTVMTFTDSSGMQWKANTEDNIARTTTNCYFYPYKPTTSTNILGAGNFCYKLEGNKVNFKHFDTSVTYMYAQFTSDAGTMYVPLTKGSDNLTWSTTCIPSSIVTIQFTGNNSYYWKTNTGRSTTAESTAYAVNKNTATRTVIWKTGNNQQNWVRIYFTDNYAWSNRYIHYWNSFQSNSWNGTKLTVYIGTNDQSQKVYFYLVPKGSSIIFHNNSGVQTVDITSGVTDMKGYYLTGTSSASTSVGTWDVTASWLYSHGRNTTITPTY